MGVDRSGEHEPLFATFVGIDWADQKHVWCLQAADSQKRESGELEHAPEAVEVWVAQLCQRLAQGLIAVALEQSRGALCLCSARYERLHLFPVPSTMAGNMREALYRSGAKDDPRDADLLLDLLLKHRDKLRRLSRDTEAIRRVQNLVEERRKLVDEKTEQINRLTSHLKIYFPQMLAWFDRLDREAACALLERWLTLEELQKVPPVKLRTFFCKHNRVRGLDDFRDVAFLWRRRGLPPMQSWLALPTPTRCGRIPGYERSWKLLASEIPIAACPRLEDVARCIAALRDPATYWLTGNTLHVDGRENIVG